MTLSALETALVDTDRNLRFGLRALANGLINSSQFAEAGQAWMIRPDVPLADVLESRGWISPADRAAIEDTVKQRPTPVDADASTVTIDRVTGSEGSIHLSGIFSDAGDASTLPRSDADGRDRTGPTAYFGERYVSARFHAEGGIGRVWKVLDQHLGREVAVKELRPELAGHPAVEQRFQAEARITARLEHPNIVPMHDLPIDAVRSFYTMRFLDGRTLRAAVQQYHRPASNDSTQTLDFRGLLDAFISVCNAMAFAHEQRVIHRDLKGSNIMLGQFGEVAVVDWGLARDLNSEEDPLARPSIDPESLPPELTRTIQGYPIGTAQYMPPEQAIGSRQTIGPRSDIFGLGAILYLILTGHAPYEGGDQTELIRKARDHEFPPPSQIKPGIPKPLESICLQAMAEKPADRYQNAKDLGDDVRRWMADEPVLAAPEKLPARIARWARKHQPAVAAAIAFLLVSSVALGIGIWRVGIESRKVEVANDAIIADVGAAVQSLQGMLGLLLTDHPGNKQQKSADLRFTAAKIATALAEKLYDRNPNLDILHRPLALLLRESANLDDLAGRLPSAEYQYRRAIDVLSHSRTDPNLPLRELDLLTEFHTELARILLRQSKVAEAWRRADQAKATADQLLILAPTDSHSVRRIARVRLLEADLEQELSHFKNAMILCAESSGLLDQLKANGESGPLDHLITALAHLGRASCLHELHQPADADVALSAAREAAEGMHDLPTDQRHILSLIKLCHAQFAMGRNSAAEVRKELDEVVRELESYSADLPFAVEARAELADALISRAEADPANADSDLSRALELSNRAVTEAPEVPWMRACLAHAKQAMAERSRSQGDLKTAKDQIRQARADLDWLLRMNPDHPQARRVLKFIEKTNAGLPPN